LETGRIGLAKFGEQFIQQVQQAIDIVELIGQYVALKLRGKEYVGLCPFHDDKKPSLNVSPTKQIFKCFACGAGGDVFKFLSLYEQYNFPEAVRALAERAHIPIPAESAAQRQTAPGLSKPDLLKVTAFAVEFYREQLHGPAGRGALDYARRRGLSDESIGRFALGYSPDGWDGLLTQGRRGGISQEQLVAAGLALRREGGGCYDRFRHRLMFPIFDPTGSVIAFGGRALSEQERAKYINSPESVLFDKSGQLFAFNWAREQIKASGTAVVVEGYLDALIPLQAGVGNVVATLGTALTERHVRMLANHAREVVLVFDADQAGAAAAERAMEIFMAQQVHVRVATIPAGKDPCDYCLGEGPEALQALIADAPDAMQHAWDRRLAEYQQAGGSPADRQKAVREFLRLVACSAAYGAIDELRQGQLAQHIGHILNVPAADLQQEMRRLSRQARGRAQTGGAPAPRDSEMITKDPHRIILQVLLNQPELFGGVNERVGADDFTNEQLAPVAQKVWSLGREDRLTLEAVMGSEEMFPYSQLLADLALAGERLGQDGGAQAMDKAVENLLYQRSNREIKQLQAGRLDDEALRQLSEHHRRPDQRRAPRIQ
jgi:DNA primase